MKLSLYVFGVAVMAASLQVALGAIVTPTAPEIDPASAVSALGLLSGGVMVLRARMRR
jgi:hypothetical protein